MSRSPKLLPWLGRRARVLQELREVGEEDGLDEDAVGGERGGKVPAVLVRELGPGAPHALRASPPSRGKAFQKKELLFVDDVGSGTRQDFSRGKFMARSDGWRPLASLQRQEACACPCPCVASCMWSLAMHMKLISRQSAVPTPFIAPFKAFAHTASTPSEPRLSSALTGAGSTQDSSARL